MKNNSVNIADAVLIALLAPCALWCLASSFDINVDLTILFVCSGIFTALFSAACVLIKRFRTFFAACLAAIAAYICFVIIEMSALLSQLEYAINSVLKEYSLYLPLPEGISLGGKAASDATLLFVLLEIFLIFISTLLVLRARAAYAAVFLSVLFTVPCFILVNTCPALAPLFIVIASSSTLITVSSLQRQSIKRNGLMSAAAFLVIIGILVGVYFFNPADSFERGEWQDELLIDFRARTGMGALNGDNLDLIRRAQDKRDRLKSVEDLSLAGNLKQTHELVMQIYPENTGAIYLRGTAYANYENNKWSVLTNKQLASFPSGIDVFSMTQVAGDEDTIKIVTRDTEELVYTPYYLTKTPAGMIPLADICIFNDLHDRSFYMQEIPYGYESFVSYSGENEYYWSEDEFAGEYESSENEDYYGRYNEFVNNNYLQISDELAQRLREIGGFDDEKGYMSEERLIEKIIDFVSSSAEYSLDTPRVPAGEDIASWLLTESDTGYCVHFATAACMMLRAYGIPARYVTGYCVESLPDEEYVTVTSDNAHAWVECYFENYGWVPFEPTPIDLDDYHAYADEIPESVPDDDEPTEPPTKASEDTGDEDKPVEENSGGFDFGLIVFIVVAIAALAATAALRVLIIRRLRKRRFYSGDRNGRAIYIYRYIARCAKRTGEKIPDDISDIGAKARFSRHEASDREVAIMLGYAERLRESLYKGCNIFRRLYYSVLLVL